MPPPNFFSKKRKLIVRVIFCGILLEMILFALFINMWFFSDTSSYALAIAALAPATDLDIAKPGLATEQFMSELKSGGLKPIPNQEMVKRSPFSVGGTLIGLGGDNIQIFEYSDHGTALKEAAIFTEKYTKSTAKNQWKNRMHLYVRGNIIIFYMGANDSILTTLNKDMNSLSLNNK